MRGVLGPPPASPPHGVVKSMWSTRSAGIYALVRVLTVVAAIVAVAVFAGIQSAAADPGDPEPPCAASPTLTAASSAVTVGQTTALSWNSGDDAGCAYTAKLFGPDFAATGAPVDLADSITVLPAGQNGTDTATYTLRVRGFNGQAFFYFSANTSIRVDMPSADGYGRRTVNLTRDYQADDFVRAVAVPNADIHLAPDINFDLSTKGRKTTSEDDGRDHWIVDIERGVHIFGGRSSTTPGARLYTTRTRLDGPPGMLSIGTYANNPADDVLIDGVRIDGGDMDIAGNPTFQDDDVTRPIGIYADFAKNLEIANSEIYGWSGQAVTIHNSGSAIPTMLTSAWVHDNYIHHNRRWRHLGYGVQAHDGAHVLIERNVFDYNRHGIEASGEPGTSYRAYNNLVLEHGGENFGIMGSPFNYVQYTHQFDVHGTKKCGGKDAYCGPAGQYFDYRYNTFWYAAGDVLKVRGIPLVGADVTNNVFKHGEDGAITQTDGNNLWASNNQFNVGKRVFSDACDFDGDQVADDLVTTGVTWWYNSGATGHYFYLATAPEDWATLTRVIRADGRCQLTTAAGVKYINRPIPGGGPTARLVAAGSHGDIVGGTQTAPTSATSARLWQIKRDLTGLSGDKQVPLWFYDSDAQAATGYYLAGGDFNGDGAPDLLMRSFNDIGVTLLTTTGGVLISDWRRHLGTPANNTSGLFRGTIASGTQLAGVGDFNGDSRADILWRATNGQLWMWPAGDGTNPIRVNYHRNIEEDDPVSTEWQVTAVADFNGDGYADIQWRNTVYGETDIWYMRGKTMLDILGSNLEDSGSWQIAATADFTGDGKADTLWRHSTGLLVIYCQGRTDIYYCSIPRSPVGFPGSDWHVQGAADFTADGIADILWRNDNGTAVIWKIDRNGLWAGESNPLSLDTGWTVRGAVTQPNQQATIS